MRDKIRDMTEAAGRFTGRNAARTVNAVEDTLEVMDSYIIRHEIREMFVSMITLLIGFGIGYLLGLILKALVIGLIVIANS